MVISTHLRFKDIFRFNLQLATSRYHWRAQIRDTVLVFIATFTWQFFSRSPVTQTEWGTALLMAFGFTAIFKLMWYVTTPLLSAWVAMQSNSLGPYEYTIDTEFISEKTRGGERKTFWSAVHSVERLRDFVAIRLNSLEYHIIPVSALPSREDFEKLCVELHLLHNTSRSAVT